jgi:hypothetical protein
MKVFSFKPSNTRPFTASLEEVEVEGQIFTVHCPNRDRNDLTVRLFVTTSKDLHLKMGRLGPERLMVTIEALDKAFDSSGGDLLFMIEDLGNSETGRVKGILVARTGGCSPVRTYVVS